MAMTRFRPRSGLLFLLVHTVVSASELPSAAPDRHLGVAACSSALCHNAVAPWRQSGARLDEYRVWRRDDPHARAFEVLRSEAGQRIGQRFGAATPEQAAVCLNCHADRASARGPRFTVNDGVTCEACHGGAERWLESHARGASHQDNLAHGMYPTDDPVRRAELCVSCHVGTTRQQVTHRLLAAGHPRLEFELDTFTARQPPHAELDDDYRARKPVPSSAELWATGQGIVARARLALIASPATWAGGAWPELSAFDCGTCHRATATDERAPPRARGPRPGLPRLATGLGPWLDVLAGRDPDAAQALSRTLAGLDVAVAAGAVDRMQRAGALSAQVAATTSRWLPLRLDAGDIDALLSRVADCEQVRPPSSYIEATQWTMAAQALLARSDPGLAPLFDRTHRFWEFDAAAFDRALRALCSSR